MSNKIKNSEILQPYMRVAQKNCGQNAQSMSMVFFGQGLKHAKTVSAQKLSKKITFKRHRHDVLTGSTTAVLSTLSQVFHYAYECMELKDQPEGTDKFELFLGELEMLYLGYSEYFKMNCDTLGRMPHLDINEIKRQCEESFLKKEETSQGLLQ